MRTLLRLAFAVVAIAFPIHALAQDATPAAALQRSERIAAIVEQLMLADLVPNPQVPARPATESRPRHVFQSALSVYDSVQILRGLNGFALNETLPTPARPVTPADVVSVIERIERDLQPLYQGYGITAEVPMPPRRADARPSDVRAKLQAIDIALRQLGVPPKMPNNVQRMALAIKESASVIAEKLGAPPRQTTPRVREAKPADVLEEARVLADALGALVQSRPELLEDGVFALPVPDPGAPITPTDVLGALQVLAADMFAVRQQVSTASAFLLPETPSGQSPADVKTTLSNAVAILRGATS